MVVVGGGGHAKVVIEVLVAAGWSVEGYTSPKRSGASQLGVEWLGSDDQLGEIVRRTTRAFVAVGDNRRRASLHERVSSLGFELVNALHPRATVSTSAKLGTGIVVMAGAVVNAAVALADGVIVNTGASVDHDCRIGRFAHVAPGCHLSGYVEVGEQAFLGIGSTVGRGERLVVGARAIVGAGSVVIEGVPDDTTVVGVPARILRCTEEARR